MVEDYHHERGYRLISREEWSQRGERWDADLTIISEAELYHLWEADPYFEREPLKSLREAALELDYYPEQGYLWSLHFDRIPD
jgi:hypothetical protein